MPTPLQLKIVNFTKDAYIVVEGKQNADHFYILRSGKVRVSKEVEVVQEEGGNVLGPGDFFGVVAAMSGHSHIETAQALTDCSAISVNKENFGDLIVQNTPVAMKIIQGFSRRMRYLDEALARITLQQSSEPDIGHLFFVAEFYAKQSQFNQAHYAYHQYLRYCPNGPHAERARQRLEKIQPYSQAVYLDGSETEFTRIYKKNTMIFSEMMPGGELYIIQKGSVKITKIVNDNEVLLAVLKQGDIFGEMSLIENKPRSASAIAFEDTQLLAVNRENFARMVSSQPQIITRLTQLLAERIWFIYKQLANTLLKDKVGRLFDGLLIQLERNRVPLRQGEAYTFEFGPKELINMVGLPMAEGREAMRELLKNSRIKVLEDRIVISDRAEIEKQAKYYRKMQKIERARRQSRL
ncbi:cAMP-binding domain of CRP or a regulatory subunit of cAMP-dependent protein kinases [Alkalispirochaeta americana]|uniref:cAMP-binding domain of CRP or a regulatory subunit of cAMP-dependent protein kinases n=1 Tax=Alkalispirochaeta americana TaxID=159291 RepID=A0A1N6N7P1_9SPIO|nr:cyclic nucleotide-binding domain-containing protein [Alkalispirochaeta americana]SIP88118.1 cAMP-binding domain of CRP or a regulatory subunit of cAMP-dependent protein kinases [Alkalispirochaeta americana]